MRSVAAPPPPQAAREVKVQAYPGLTDKEKKDLYTLLVRCRTLDERMRKLFRAGRFAGTYFSGVGQEATTIGTAYNLRQQDVIAPAHREIGASVAKGVPTLQLIAQAYARKNSVDKGKSHPCHYGWAPLNVINPASTIAGQTVVGTGCALAFKLRREDHVVLAYCGEGATANGAWYEALNFAAIHKLGMIFVVQNNLWAESVPARLGAALEDYHHRADGVGCPGVSIDGNDVFRVYEVAREAIARARKGLGPTVIECKTYRWYGHSEIDPADYRTQKELEYWQSLDPVPRAEKHLRELGILTDALKQKIISDLEKEVEEAVDICENTPYAEPEEALRDVYADSPK